MLIFFLYLLGFVITFTIVLCFRLHNLRTNYKKFIEKQVKADYEGEPLLYSELHFTSDSPLSISFGMAFVWPFCIVVFICRGLYFLVIKVSDYIQIKFYDSVEKEIVEKYKAQMLTSPNESLRKKAEKHLKKK